MSPTQAALKDNVVTFARDVQSTGGYAYTQDSQFSCVAANRRLTDATVQAMDPTVRQVLDVGCGDGTYTQALQNAFPLAHFTGFDPAEAAIARAHRTYPGIRFCVGNVLEAADLPKGPFDVAILRGVLHHTSNPALAIAHCARHARRLIIIEPNGYNPILKIIERASAYHRHHEERSFFPRTLRRWCGAAGLQVDGVGYVGFVPFFCPDPAAQLLHRVQPLLESIPLLRNTFAAVSVIRCSQRDPT
jgi:SAM-dependent methyltransferase